MIIISVDVRSQCIVYRANFMQIKRDLIHLIGTCFMFTAGKDQDQCMFLEYCLPTPPQT